MTKIDQVSIAPAPMPLSRMLEIYDNLPKEVQATFVKDCISPKDQETATQAIIEHQRAKQIQALVKESIKTLKEYENTTTAEWDDTWEHLANTACKLLLELTDYDLKDAHDTLAMYINANCPV